MERRTRNFLALILFVVALIVLACGIADAQSPATRDTFTGANGDTLTFRNDKADTAATFEYLYTGSPASSSIVLNGCMVGGTCDAIETYTGNTNSTHVYSGTKVYDYFTVGITLSGGSSPKLKVNRLSVRAGIPSLPVAGSVSLTGQTASIASTDFSPAITQPGLYRATGYVWVTTAGTAGAVQIFLNCDNGSGANSLAMGGSAGLSTVAGMAGGVATCQLGGATTLKYVSTVSGATGSPQYSMKIVVEKLN